MRLYYAVLCNDIVYVHITISVLCHAQCSMNFSSFQRFILKAPQAALFHATAIHCHNGMDNDDASVFILGSELLVYTQF